MKSSPCCLSLSMIPFVAAAVLGIPATLIAQTSGTYSNLASGSWPVTTNWTGGTVAAGVDAVADLSTLNITATRTVTLDGARTVGTVRFGDATNVSNDQVLNTGTAGPLTLDVSADKAILENQNRTTTIGAVLAGSDGISITNGTGAGGTVILGAANTFTGGLDITGTIVQLNNNASANTGANANAIRLLPGTPVSRLVINGGITNNSSISVPENLTGATGEGVLRQTGTGLGTLSGPISIMGTASAGGHLVGGGSAVNALVLNGQITAGVNLVHREGFVRYGGTGSSYGLLLVTNTALVGATDGICPTATVNLGPSANGALDLNGFDQTLAGLNLGYNINPSAFIGTVNLGARTLTMAGDIVTGGSAPAPHVINATTGALNAGATGRSLVVADSALAEELIVNNAAFTGTGGFFKTGDGTVSLLGTTATAPFSLDAGGLSIGRRGEAGSFSMASLALGNGTRLLVDAGAGGDLANAGSLTLNGVADLVINQLGGILAPGLYPFLNYTGTSPGLAGFNLLPVGHSTSSLVDTGSAIALQVTANQRLTWNGTVNSDWSVVPNGNWKLPGGPADYIEGDDVIFPGNAAGTMVELSQNVNPSLVTFTNDTPAEYVVSAFGNFGIGGAASLIKSGTGKTTLRTSNSYRGATTVTSGILELDHDSIGNTVLTGSSGVTLASGTTLQLTRDDGGFSFSRSLSGNALLQLNAHSNLGGTTAHSISLTGNNSAFSGPVQLLSPQSGTYRLASVTPAQLGTGAVEVQNGAQVLTAANQTYPNPITIEGIGFRDSGGNIGALRLEGGSVWAGPVTIAAAGARIGCLNATATVSGAISGADLNVNGSDGSYNNSHTLIFTGTNTYGKTTIGGGSTATAVSSRRLNIGNGGTTGTLGSGVVVITGDAQNGILGFDRLDGYTLAAGQTITNIGDQPTRTFLDVETRGTGLSQNGQATTLGAAAPSSGGQIRVAQARTGSIFNTDGPITVEQLRVSTGVTDGVLNVKAGSVINTNQYYFGDVANGSATGHQAAGSTVNVVGQMRLGHFGTETAIYNMNGGALSLTGPSPSLTPSTAGAGAASATGDNNINATAVTAIVGGGIYLGIDGTGVFNQNGGNVSTNWIVLDNRTNNGPGANMLTGQDEYNLAAGTLALRSTWGMIQRNATAAFNLSGGTVTVDNTGTGTGTGANLTIPLDCDITVRGTGSTLDTNGAGNAFLLSRSVLGNGSLALAGGGVIKFNTAGVQTIAAALTGSAAIQKEGTGTTVVSGNSAGFTGPVNVTAGRLDLPASAVPASITLAAGAALATESTPAALTLNGGTLLFDPTTAGALTTPSLTVNGAVLLDFSKAPLADATYTVISYGSKTGAGTFSIAGSTNYRSITFADTGSAITVTLANTKNLTWKGTAGTGTAWDINTTSNWNSPGADNFFLGDSVLFDDTALQTAVIINAGVAPRSTRVNSSTSNFTFTTTGAGISGGGTLIKEGSSTLTLAGPNSYSGRTEIRGGILTFNSTASLGSGLVGNSLLIDGSGRLSYNAATALDLGINRDIAVGNDGGSLSHNNATAATIAIPGRISGSGPLVFHSAAAGAGTFVLSGDNSGYSGAITVEAPAAVSGGLTILRLNNQASVPASSSITLKYPAAANATGNATTLDLANVTLSAGLTLNLTSLQTGISLRTQLTSTGNSVVNGPVNLSGTGIIQFNLPNGTMTLNGNISEGPTPFTNVCFLRGAGGTGFINGVINLPAANLFKTDANTWRINTSGHTWANTSILVGGITLGISDALVPTAPLVLGQNDGNAVTLNLNGFNQTVGSLSSNPTAVGANTTGKTITSTSPSVFTVTQNTNNTYAGLLTGSVSLVKEGPSALTLAGASTNTGSTAVNSGILLVANTTGSATGTGAVSVNNNATLGGRGLITGPVTVNGGGTLSPGTGVGLLATGPTTLSGAAAIAWEISDWSGISGTGFDTLSATSLAISATSASPVTLRITSPGLVNFTSASRSFRLATTTGGITGFDPAAFIVDASGFAGGAGIWTVSQSGNDLLLNFASNSGTPYSVWADSKNLTGGNADFGADPDLDSVINLAEFAVNSEPRSAVDSGKLRVAVASLSGQDYLTLTLPVRTGIALTGATELAGTGSGIRYRIQGDTALNSWTADMEEVTPVLSSGLPALDSGWIYRTFRTASPITPGTRQFIRGKFEVAP